MVRHLLVLVTLLCFSCTSQKTEESIVRPVISEEGAVVTVIPGDTVVADESVEPQATPSASEVNKFRLSRQITPSLTAALSPDSLINDENKTGFHAVIDNKRDTTLHLPEGTVLKIPAMAFKSRGGRVDNVELIIKEFYALSDIVLANLTTTTEREMLETAGMIHITASSAGVECNVDTTKRLEISFPVKGEKQEGMQLFSGTRDSVNCMMWAPLNLNDSSKEFTVYTITEQAPQFPGGYESAYRYIRSNLKYPSEARRRCAEGTVYIQFIIDESGNVTSPSVLRGIDETLDQAAADAIAGMPRWKPGQENGIPVKTRQVLPVRFSLGGTSLPGGPVPFSDAVVENVPETTYTDSTITKARAGELLYYVFKTAKLGWINCDRFIDVKNRVTFRVRIPDTSDGDVDVKLIFDRYRSIMPGARAGRYYYFANVPRGEKASVLAFRSTVTGLEMTTTKVKMSATPDALPPFEPVSVEKLENYLQGLDRR